MNILHLRLKKQWFDMIASGKKREEYREVKPYWTKRLVGKGFDFVRFRNGYFSWSPVIDVDFRGVSVGRGNVDWGAPFRVVYIVSLGGILRRTNC